MYARKGGRRMSAGRQSRDVLLRTLSERRPDLQLRLRDIGELALAVGRELHMGPEGLDEVARAAELHDVGKIAVPDAILDKPGPLDPVEWSFMRRHPLIGERILLEAPALRPVARLVRSSHERWDGGGYPDGLRGDEIPLGARVVAVCDAFDAMTTERPYRQPVSEEDAIEELRRCAGTQFDPMVVEAFCRVVARERDPATYEKYYRAGHDPSMSPNPTVCKVCHGPDRERPVPRPLRRPPHHGRAPQPLLPAGPYGRPQAGLAPQPSLGPGKPAPRRGRGFLVQRYPLGLRRARHR